MKGQSENNDLKKKFDDFTYPVSETNWDAISARLPDGKGNGFLGDKFSNYTHKPSSNVWSNIASVIQPSHKKRPAAWWWYGAAASALLLIYLGYTIFTPVDNQSQLAEEKITKEQNTGTNKPSVTGEIPVVQDSLNTTLITSDASSESNTIKRDSDTHTEIEKDVQTTSKNFKPAYNKESLIANSHAVPVAEKYTTISGPDEYNRRSENKDNTNATSNVPATPMTQIPLRNSQIQVQHAQAVLAGEWKDIAFIKAIPDEKHKKNTGFFDGTESSSPQEFSLWGGSQIAFAGPLNDNNRATFESYDSGNGLSPSSANSTNHYSPPIYYGINSEIKFWNRFAGGLGLGYLRMHTTSTQNFGSGNQVVQEISDNYLSVPVYLKFNFINKPRFAAYTSAGHAFDIMIGQRVSSETYQSSQLTASDTNRNGRQGNQANVYTGLGMHFKFTKFLGVFTEGSLLHYYKMSKTNFYSQQNYWPTLRFGILVSFR